VGKDDKMRADDALRGIVKVDLKCVATSRRGLRH